MAAVFALQSKLTITVFQTRMTQISFAEVEEWLDKHADLCQDYFLRKAELVLINKWLIAHGYCTINDYINSSRRSLSTSRTSNFYANDGTAELADKQQVPSILINGNGNRNTIAAVTATYHRRSNSKKCLRHDFARTKSKSFVKSNDIGNGVLNKEAISTSRRSSLKDMRK